MAKRQILKKSAFQDWPPYCNRYVAVFDVTSLINYRGPMAPTTLDVFKRLLKLGEAAENIEHMRGSNSSVVHEDHASGHLKFFQLFDKVTLVTLDNSKESQFLIELATIALFVNAFCLGLPVRGSIAVGEAIVDLDQNICIGRAFNNAVKTLSEQEWLGVLYHESMKDDQSDSEFVREATDNDIPLSIYTDVPVKEEANAIKKEVQVLNWPAFLETASNALDYLNDVKNSLGLESTSIYYNTAKFIRKQLS